MWNLAEQRENWRAARLSLGGAWLTADPSGALYWDAERTLVVADLHFEKGSFFAARGVMLPPYDTAATLASLRAAISYYGPRRVIALGDSFHDMAGGARLSPQDRAAIAALQRGRDWIWISGNHDPDAVEGIGGEFAEALQIGPLRFRHEPAGEAFEVIGHFHPVARVSVRGRSLRRRCFASSQHRLVLPAFGAFTGGLNIRDLAFANLMGGAFLAHILGSERVFALTLAYCLPD